MRPLHYALMLLLLAVVIGVGLELFSVGLELFGIAREDAQRWSIYGLSETYCEPNAYCQAFKHLAMGVVVLAGAMLLHRTAKSKTVKVLDIVAGVLVILLFAGFLYSEVLM